MEGQTRVTEEKPNEVFRCGGSESITAITADLSNWASPMINLNAITKDAVQGNHKKYSKDTNKILEGVARSPK